MAGERLDKDGLFLGFLEFGFLGLGLVLGFWFKGLAEIFMAKRTAF